MRTLLYKSGLMMAFAALVVSLFLVGQALAQTTCSADQVMCYPSGSSTGGWCQMPPCPTNDTTYTPPPSTYTPPATTTDAQTTCTNSGYKWCNSSSGSGWCSNSASYTCPAYDSASCSAQSGEWCAYTGGTGGWCATPPSSCPINDQATCTAKGRSWCTSSGGGSGWCTSSATEKCPAYNEADCTAQSKTWCVSPGTATTSGWCTDSCPYSATTQTDAKTTCTNSNYKWCLNSDGATGWCSYNSSAAYTCPAYDSASCTAQSGEWCTYTTGTGGWCNTSGGCPINDSATCIAKGRKWCTSTYGSGWCTATATETCPSTSTDTTTPPAVTPVNFSWPNTQVDCEKYQGKWCPSTGSYTYSSGSCNMANQACWESPKAGYMTCWDNTQVLSGSVCPTMPSTETECKRQNKYWCNSTAGGTSSFSVSFGWCSGTPCSVMPPAGKMTCPDGVSFGATLTECPQKSSTTPVPTPVTTLCPDGSRVVIGATCPSSYTCPNGTIVKSSDQCPKQEDPIATCLQRGGMWCYDDSSKKSGYCSTNGFCKSMPPTPEPFPQPQPQPEPTPMPSPDMSKQIEREKKDMLRELRMFERYFKKLKDDTMLSKIAALSDKIQKIDGKTEGAMSVIESMHEEIQIMREAYQDTMENDNQVNDRERDEKFQKQALRDMKNGAKNFEKYLKRLDARIAGLEKKGFTVDSTVKDTLAKAKELVANAKTATTYDEIKNIMEQLPELVENLNDFMPRLEQLARIPQVLKLIAARVTAAERLVKQTEKTAARLKFDATDEIQKMKTLLDEIKSSLEQVKSASFEDDLFTFIQDNILEKLADIQQISNNLKNVASVKKYVNQAAAKIKKYEQRIVKMEKKGEDVSEQQFLLDEAQTHLDDLRALSGQKLTEESALEIIEHLRALTDTLAQLAESLRIVTPDALEQQLKKSLQGAAAMFKQFEVNEIEKLMVKAFHVANYFRLSPQRSLAILME